LNSLRLNLVVAVRAAWSPTIHLPARL